MAEHLGELLRTFRSEALLSQEALAERAQVSARTIGDIETGVSRAPRLITIMLLAEAMKLSPADRARLQQAARKPVPAQTAEHKAPIRVRSSVPLVGREQDAVNVAMLLSRDEVRLVTLVGPAGVGKTSLATNVASAVGGSFELGAFMIELAPIAEPAQVPWAVARALEVRESAGQSVDDALHAFLRKRTVLLLLDNLEHLTPAVPWIRALLTQCHGVKMLATSREPLHLDAEYVYALSPLDRSAAVRLFVQRAQTVKPEFTLTQSNAAAVDTIVEHLEGLPLAIELAAPRLLLLSASALASRLERRLPLLADGALDRPLRQQTMQGAIAWSYDLLSPAEQRLFRCLSVLRDGGTLEAAAALAGMPADQSSILVRLAPLVEKNMVVLAEDAFGEPRVRMLELIAEYARDRLEESGELPAASRRHAQYVLEFSQRANAEFSGDTQLHSLRSIERDLGNIRAALEWAARNGATVLGFELLAPVWRFFAFRGYLSEAVGWLQRFFAMRARDPSEVPDLLYANALRAYGILLVELGNRKEAASSIEEAIEIQRRCGNAAGLADSLRALGSLYEVCGEYERAEESATEALAIFKRLGKDAGVAGTLSGLAGYANLKREFARASAFGEESVEIYRRLGQEWGVAYSLLKVGFAALGLRRYERAEAILEEALSIQRAIGNTGSMHYTLEFLGIAAQKRGEYRRALAYYYEAFDRLDTAPGADAVAHIIDAIAVAIALVGAPAQAARLLGAAHALRGTSPVPLWGFARDDYETSVAAIRDALGGENFELAWRMGASMTLKSILEEVQALRNDYVKAN